MIVNKIRQKWREHVNQKRIRSLSVFQCCPWGPNTSKAVLYNTLIHLLVVTRKHRQWYGGHEDYLTELELFS